MKQHKALGKGLRALISETEIADEAQVGTPSQIAIELIDPNPFQPRLTFSESSIDELKESILRNGVLQPVLVRPHRDRFQLILGERRLRACRAAGLDSIPAIIREVESNEEMLELAILENIQREDLNPIELAHALTSLQLQYNLTQEAISEKMGVSRAHISNTMRLLKLPARVQDALSDGKITMGHARALLSLASEREQVHLFERFIAEAGMTVRGAESIARSKSKKKPRVSNDERDFFPEHQREAKALARVEDLLKRNLSTQVKIKPKGKGGVVEITYYNMDDLTRLIEMVER